MRSATLAVGVLFLHTVLLVLNFKRIDINMAQISKASVEKEEKKLKKKLLKRISFPKKLKHPLARKKM